MARLKSGLPDSGRVGVSIIIPALKKPEELYADLGKQTFKDFEIVPVQEKMRISAAWNRGIEKAKGKRIILLESDARVYDSDWLEKMVKLIDKHKVVKAGEVVVDELADDINNLGMAAEVAEKYRFDESFAIAEDVEFQEKLRQANYDIYHAREPLVWHYKKFTARKAIVWGFDTGVAYSRIALEYHNPNMNFKRILRSRAFVFMNFIMIVLGEVYGFVRYFYTAFNKIEDHRKPRNPSK